MDHKISIESIKPAPRWVFRDVQEMILFEDRVGYGEIAMVEHDPNVGGHMSIHVRSATGWEFVREDDEPMNFGEALDKLKEGLKVQREGWNGKGMFLYYVNADKYPAKMEIAKTIADDEGKVPYGAYVALKTVNGTVIPWTPNMLDMLAEDWQVVY